MACILKAEDRTKTVAVPSKTFPIQLTPQVRVDLLQSEYGYFLGLGNVVIHGTSMRNGSRLILPRLDTPDGILYTRFKLKDVEYGSNGVTRVHLNAIGLPWGRGELSDNYNQPLIRLNASHESVSDELILVLQPSELVLGGRDWRGFSYSFEYRSSQRSIHRLLTLATWEIGGTIKDNTVLSQGQVNPPVFHGGKDKMFTTACLNSLDQYGSGQGYSYQLGARGGLNQVFDFQYAPQGALLQFWPDLDNISSLTECPPGSDVLHIVDEYRFPLTNHVITAPKWVVFTPGALAAHEARNLWWDAYEDFNDSIRRKFDIQPTVVVPEIGLKYRTRVNEGKLCMTVSGKEVESHQVPYAIGDRVMPQLAAQGIRRFFPEVMSQSDVTEDGLKRKLDFGVHSDLHCASVCATRRFLPAEFWGGMAGWKYMADKARTAGVEMGTWFAPHLSPRAAIYEQHPEYRLIDPAGLPASGGYGISTLVMADWNSGIRDWALADLKRWKEEGGLVYVFTDSLANMGVSQVNYASGMRGNFGALGRFYGDLQRIGIKSLTLEGVTPFGASRFGISDLRGDLMEPNRAVAGQNDFGWWVGEEDMAFNLCLLAGPRKRTALELEQIQFRAMANRGFVMYETLISENHELPAWWTRLNHIYNQALPHMKIRRLLPNGSGVRWEDGATQVIWTFREMSLNLRESDHVQRLEGREVKVMESTERQIILPAWGVYRIQS